MLGLVVVVELLWVVEARQVTHQVTPKARQLDQRLAVKWVDQH
jgi:hypothetical protein